MNQAAQCAVVGSKSIGGVEAVPAAPAQTADAFGIEREVVSERGTAAGAMKIRGKAVGGGETGAADGNTRKLA